MRTFVGYRRTVSRSRRPRCPVCFCRRWIEIPTREPVVECVGCGWEYEK